jgi:hypothetical protein
LQIRHDLDRIVFGVKRDRESDDDTVDELLRRPWGERHLTEQHRYRHQRPFGERRRLPTPHKRDQRTLSSGSDGVALVDGLPDSNLCERQFLYSTQRI